MRLSSPSVAATASIPWSLPPENRGQTRGKKFMPAILEEAAELLGIPVKELQRRGLQAFLEHELRSVQVEILTQEVFVLAEQHSPQGRCTVKQLRVRQPRRTIFLSRQHVHSTQTHPFSDCSANMNIHVKIDAHGRLPIARNRLVNGESPACAMRASTSRSCRSIAASNAC